MRDKSLYKDIWVEKKRKDYTFRRRFNEKPSIILGCPGYLGAMRQSCGGASDMLQCEKAQRLEIQETSEKLCEAIRGLKYNLEGFLLFIRIKHYSNFCQFPKYVMQ